MQIQQNGKRGKILIVEDDAGLAELIKEFFREYGYESEIALDGIKARELLKKQEYGLILTDLYFYWSGGIDLIRTIRDKDVRTPIGVITGYGSRAAQEAMKVGAHDFILKPFNLPVMKRKIGKFLDLERMARRFGMTAVERGFVTLNQLIEAWKVQVRENIENGKHRLIGEILLQQGKITEQQIDEVIKFLSHRENGYHQGGTSIND